MDAPDNFKTLKDLFPHVSAQLIEDILGDVQNDIDAAVDLLLDAPVAPDMMNETPQDNNPKLPDKANKQIFVDSTNARPFTRLPDLIVGVGKEQSDPNNIIFINSSPPASPVGTNITLDACISDVLAVLPDVCTNHVEVLYTANRLLHAGNIAEFIINSLFDTNGRYPKSQLVDSNGRKRKFREVVDEKSPAEEYTSPGRDAASFAYISLSRKILAAAFPLVPAAYINSVLQSKDYYLYPSHQQIADDEYNLSETKPPKYYHLQKARRTSLSLEAERNVVNMTPEAYTELVNEMDAAKNDYEALKLKRQQELDEQLAMKYQEEEAVKKGHVFECQCCFGDYIWNKSTQCEEGHLFCLECCQRLAEIEVGAGKYKLFCMDGSGCKAAFSYKEMDRFLTEKTKEALLKYEQADMLRIADIEDLTQCPFCDFAAICPPIKIDKEFRCENEECLEVSCRHCKERTHIPKSCEENKKEGKLSLRRRVEEAKTEALLRKCKKCGLGYIKESGCNKIHCSRCNTLSCYICSEIIKDYSHFNDASRGGKVGQCPLFDNTEERHELEIGEAEKAVIEKIRLENPELVDEDLKIEVSKQVADAEKARIAAQPNYGVPPAVRANVVMQNAAAAVGRAQRPIAHPAVGIPAMGDVNANLFMNGAMVDPFFPMLIQPPPQAPNLQFPHPMIPVFAPLIPPIPQYPVQVVPLMHQMQPQIQQPDDQIQQHHSQVKQRRDRVLQQRRAHLQQAQQGAYAEAQHHALQEQERQAKANAVAQSVWQQAAARQQQNRLRQEGIEHRRQQAEQRLQDDAQRRQVEAQAQAQASVQAALARQQNVQTARMAGRSGPHGSVLFGNAGIQAAKLVKQKRG